MFQFFNSNQKERHFSSSSSRSLLSVVTQLSPIRFLIGTISITGALTWSAIKESRRRELIQFRYQLLRNYKSGNGQFATNKHTYHPKETIVEKVFDFRWAKDVYIYLTRISAAHLAILASFQIIERNPYYAMAFTHYFVDTPKISSPITLLTSWWTHIKVPHFVLNSVALWTFGPLLASSWHTPLFVSFYMTAGVISATSSSIVRSMKGRITGKRPLSSMGASGAICGVIGALGYVAPESEVVFLLFPFVNFPLKYAVVGLMSLDSMGLIMGWKFFDHAAHLSGTIFGYTFASYQSTFWEPFVRFTSNKLEKRGL